MQLNIEINKTPTLPNVPAGLSHLIQALNQGDIHFVMLSKEIENFPNIAAKIISVSNSAWFSPITPITSLLDACSRLGLNNVRNIAIALSITEAFNPSKCEKFDEKLFWRTALLNAEAANLCAENNTKIDAQTARTAGLFYNIGLLWLAFNKPEETSKAIDLAQSYNTPLVEHLQNEMFTDHHITGAMLAQAMRLPLPLVNAIACSNYNYSNDFSDLEINMIKAHELAELTMQLALEIEERPEDESANLVEDENILILLKKLKSIEAIADSLFRASK